MNAACVAIRNESFLVNYPNCGVSDDAYMLVRKEEEIQSAISESVTVGYKQMLQAIFEALEECSVNNWDGYNAKAIDPGSFEEALRFSGMLPTTIPIPETDVDASGEFVFEWHKGPRKVFSVVVEGNNVLTYAGLFGTNKTSGTEYFGDELPKTILDNLQRLLSRTL